MKKTPKKPVKRPRSCVMETSFLEDLRFWVGGDRKIAIRVLDLVGAVMRDPFDGIGKPEPLKYSSANTWSRRIIDEHRLLYRTHLTFYGILKAAQKTHIHQSYGLFQQSNR